VTNYKLGGLFRHTQGAYSLRPIDASHSAMPFMPLPVDLRANAARAPRAATLLPRRREG
jgi:hypothetical protein